MSTNSFKPVVSGRYSVGYTLKDLGSIKPIRVFEELPVPRVHRNPGGKGYSLDCYRERSDAGEFTDVEAAMEFLKEHAAGQLISTPQEMKRLLYAVQTPEGWVPTLSPGYYSVKEGKVPEDIVLNVVWETPGGEKWGSAFYSSGRWYLGPDILGSCLPCPQPTAFWWKGPLRHSARTSKHTLDVMNEQIIRLGDQKESTVVELRYKGIAIQLPPEVVDQWATWMVTGICRSPHAPGTVQARQAEAIWNWLSSVMSYDTTVGDRQNGLISRPTLDLPQA